MSGTARAWVTIALLCLTTATIKAVGPFLLGTDIPKRLLPVVILLPSALVTGLVVAELFEATDHGMTVDAARIVGLTAALAAILLRLPLGGVLVAAAVAAAAFRALT
jgi:hypothetical protein